MSDTSATIIAASLSSEELEKSIYKLVGNVATATELIRKDFDDTVSHVKKSLSSIGDIKINTGGSGTSKGGTGLKQVEQEAKSATASLDNFAKSQQVAIRTSSEKYRNADTLETMKIQLELLRQRLIEARQQYSSFVAMAANATKTGDEGLYKFATSNVHAFEAEAKNLIQQIRGVQNAIAQIGDVIAPQGHLIQNWISSIGKVSPELQQLGNQIKNNSLLTQQSSRKTIQSSEEEIAATKRRVETEHQAAIQNGVFYQSLRQDIRSAGIQAQETSKTIMRNMFEQINSGSKEPIRGLKELEEAVVRMRRAFFDMDSTQKQSPLGVALENDIKKAQDAITLIQRYNRELSGVQFVGKDTIGSTRRSYDELKNTLSQLTREYNQLGKADRDAAKGTELRDKIHAFNREIRDVQRTMSRPTSLKKALGLDESTLDHINDKLQALRAYKGGLKITDQKQLDEMKQVDEKIVSLQKNYDKLMAKNQQMIGSNNALGRSWNYMKNRLAFYFSVGASTQFVKNLIEVRSQYEMNERALGILINSAERGTQIFNELSQMALVSPYTLIELSTAAKQLTAYDVAAKDVVETTRRLADMASAVGVPMERLTYALGQIKAYGYLNSRDARMFANAGIPLVRELSKYYSELEGKVVSVGDVYDRMKKKAIDYNSVMAVVTKMTDEGGKFFDFQAKMADTLKVRLANLTLAWNNMLNDIGASQQGVLTSGIGILRDLFLHWQDIYGAIQRVVLAIGLWKGAQALALLAIGELNTKMGMQVLLGEKLQTRLSGLAGSTKNLVSGYAAAGAALLFVIADAIMTYQRNAEEIEKLNKVIVDGAKESANSIYEFIESAEMSYARLSARTGKLPKPDAEKTWDALREQIELSAISAKDIIPELITIEDLNERVTKAFNLAERIAEANNKLIDLDGKLDISQNSILFGLFGEGLVEDIDDFNERLRISAQTEELYFKSTGSVITDVVQGLTGFFNDMKEKLGSSTNEAEIEIKNFAHNAANAIKDELGEEGLKDSIQVNEAVSRVLKGIEQQFPQIKGQGKALFESIYNDIMAKEFEGAVDKQAYYYKLFLERLKKDHGSAFRGVTDDILKETHRWSSGQENAIKKTAEKVKTDLPLAAQDAIDQILNQLNNTDFKLRIVTEFATTTLDEVQKQFKDKFINKPWIADQKEREKAETEAQQRYGNLMRKTTESNVEYEKRVSDERKKQLELSQKNAEIIAANKNKQDALSKAIVKDAQEQKKAADDWLKAADKVEDVGGYDFSTKGENAAARKAQKQAESELQKALKDELQLIDKVRSQYKKLTDAGATDGEALAMVTNQFANSLAHVNNVLGKNGIPLFDISKFAGTDNPRALLDMLKLQLDSAKIARNIKPEEIKELEVKYSEIVVDAKSYDLTKITKGLNNELDRLKDEYELAVSLDADPELGSIFADWMGIDMNDLPKTASEYAERASKELNKYLKQNNANVELPNLLNITDNNLREFTENKSLTDAQLEIVTKSVKAAREVFRKETSDQIKEWDKLLEKYAEYEQKIKKIEEDAEKERKTAIAKGAPQWLLDAIENMKKQRQAQAAFEEFQKRPEWIVATGDIATMTNDALRSLVKTLDDYRKKGNLTEKQTRQINKAMSSLHKEIRKSNPFNVTIDMLDQAKERASLYDEEIEKTKKSLKELEDAQSKNGELTDEQSKKYKTLSERLQELTRLQKEAGKVDFSVMVQSLKEFDTVVKDTSGLLTDMMGALSGNDANEAIRQVENLKNLISKTSEGARIGSQFGGYGSVIGAAAGFLTALFENYSDDWSGNLYLTEQVENSKIAIKQLTNEYKNLEYEIENAYGMAVYGAKRAAAANKELQLAELKRQLQLEESRESKNYDEEKVQDLKGQIVDLENEIKKATKEIVTDMLGITSVASAAETLVTSMLTAFKKGENYMDEYKQSFSDMIDSMIVKAITSKVIGDKIEQMVSNIEEKSKNRAEQQAIDLSKITDPEQYTNLFGAYLAYDLDPERLGSNAPMPTILELIKFVEDKIAKSKNEEEKKMFEEYLNTLQKMYTEALTPTPEDITSIRAKRDEWQTEVKEIFDAYMEAFNIEYGQDKTQTSLSALKQGIQGVTEDTAGAIEAYMNGVSQQVYLHSELLTQIRDAVDNMSGDAMLGTISEILLQLQSSYQTQEAIRSMLEGWSTPSGQAVKVELIS